MTAAVLISGDDTDVTVSLQDANGAAVSITGATSVLVALVRPNRAAVIAGPYTASSGYTGASWGTGVVVVPVPGADTLRANVPGCEIEVEVILAGKKTTYLGASRIQVVKGLIS